MTNTKLLLIEDEAVKGIEPHPHSNFSDIFTQVARVAIKQFEKQEKYAHLHHPLNHTGFSKDKFFQEQKLRKEEEDDKRAGTKLVIDEEDFKKRAYNRFATKGGNFIEELTSMNFQDRLRKERKLKRSLSEEEETCTNTYSKQPQPKKQKANRLEPIHIPNLPYELEKAIKDLNGRRVKLLIQKELTKTDTSRSHNRLSIMQSQFMDPDFLTEEEKRFLNTRVGANPAQKRVRFIHPSGKEGVVTFKKWDLKSSLQYVFITEWSRICESNGLAAGVVVQVWTFRTPDDELGFALARV